MDSILQGKHSWWLAALGILLAAYVVAPFFGENTETPIPPAGRSLGTPVSNMSRISVSEDERLIGILFDHGGDIRIKVLTISGDLLYEGSLREFHPHRTVAFNKITFSPDGRFAAFSINALENNLQSRIFLLDLVRKTMVDLARPDQLGRLAYTYESAEGPVWLDERTLIYVHRFENSAQELVFVNFDNGEEVLPRKKFCYTPKLSHSNEILAYSATGERGKSRVFLMDLASPGEESPVHLEGEFNNISQLAWSPDDRYLAFTYQDEESSREGISPVIVYDIQTRKPIYRIKDYLSSPQWLDNNFLMTGYWASTPFHGQNVHTFSKCVVFDVAEKARTNYSIKAINENLRVLHDSGQIVTVEGDRLMIADFQEAFTAQPKTGGGDNGSPLDPVRAFVFGRTGQKENVPAHPAETSLDVNTWRIYRNYNFGVSFKRPSDWSINAASGDGYLNILLGKGTDGIEIRLTTLDGERFDRPEFEKTIVRDATVAGLPPVSLKDFEKITLGANEFYRIERGRNISGGAVNYTYYLNQPVYGKAFADMTDIIIITVNSYVESAVDPDPGGDFNPSHVILKKMLSTLEVKDRPAPKAPDSRPRRPWK